MLYLLQYTFFSMKNRAQRAQEQNRARASPSGTACLIGKAPQIWHRINALQPPPAPPGAPKHPRWVYCTLLPPKYTISRPKSPPTSPTVSALPDHHFWHCLYIFTSAPNPCSTSPPYYTPPPSHPAPPAYQPSYPPHPKTLLPILTSPGTTAILLFFGWWGIPGVD
jgi:hypothetical protein